MDVPQLTEEEQLKLVRFVRYSLQWSNGPFNSSWHGLTKTEAYAITDRFGVKVPDEDEEELEWTGRTVDE